MVKQQKKAKGGKSVVFKKKDGSSVYFKAKGGVTSKKRSKPNPPAEAPQ